jgi:hypothetical protein
MALTNTDRKVIHAGNGSATVFPYGFPILSDAHLSVIFTDAAGGETTLSPSLYAAAGIGSLTGGSITYPLGAAPIPAGTRLTIVRTVPYTQTTVLSNQGGYYPEVVERRFDEIYMAIQQLAEIVGRTTVGSISDPATEQSNYALIQALQTFRGGIDKLTTAGDLLTRDGSGYRRLPRGTAGQFLGISGADPVWATPAINLATSEAIGVLPRAKGGFEAAAVTASLGANVNMTATGTYFTGPSIAQGTDGTWWVSGTVTLANTVGGDTVNVKLWDGATVIASCRLHITSVAGTYCGVAQLSGYILGPAGNLRISVSPVSRTDGLIAYNVSGNSKDSSISAFRIA